MSVTQSRLNASQARTSTPRGPSRDQSAISTAPVSEAGTMAARYPSGSLSSSRVLLMASSSLALVSGWRWLRPTSAPLSRSTDQPGCLGHGPEEKLGFLGLTLGFVSV